MYEKRGEESKPVIEQQSPASQTNILVVVNPNYRKTVEDMLHRCGYSNEDYSVAIDTIEARKMLDGKSVVITDDSAIAMRANGATVIRRDSKDFSEQLSSALEGKVNLYSGQKEYGTQERKKRVLIVDDDKTQLDLYQQTFEAQGYEVKTAPNRDEAFKLIKKEKGGLDVIITNYKLPESPSGGLHVLQTARKECPGTPVIIHTNYHISERILSAVKGFGAYEVLTKSFDSHQRLVDLVEEALGVEKALEVEEALDPQPSKDGQSPTPLTDGTIDEYVRKIRAQSSAKGPFSPAEVLRRFRLRFEDSHELEKLRQNS